MNGSTLEYWRTLLVLGRVSNLPTVWSNCLAGWLLAGGTEWIRFGILCLGATLIYSAGMYLNDAFDAEFDAQHRRERPVPAGKITLKEVWLLGWSGLSLGGILLMSLGKDTALLTFFLMTCVVVYDAIHKMISFSPVIMAGCRFFLYLVAASITETGVTGWAVWCSLGLSVYVVGLSFLARKESLPGALRFWPAYLLMAPILVAMFINAGHFRTAAMLWSVVLLFWIGLALRHTYWSAERRVGRSVGALLAGIALVDLLGVMGNYWTSLVFLALFGLALLAQRFVPAT